jgi:DNA-binding MarR family transcriptional regulator
MSEHDQPEVSSPIEFNETVHQKTRLGILAVLREAGEADFAFLRKTLGLTDGNLGRHLEVLASAGYVESRSGYNGRRARTWIRLTPAGETAINLELAALKELIIRLEHDPR